MRVGEGACRAWCACEGRCGWVEVWAQPLLRFASGFRLPPLARTLSSTCSFLMFVVVEATLSALCGWQGPTTPAVHRHGVALQQMSIGHRIHQVRMSSKRKAKSAEAAGEVVVVDEAIQNILDDERCNVCLTHVNADFDSLAGTGHQVSKTVGPAAVAAHRAITVSVWGATPGHMYM